MKILRSEPTVALLLVLNIVGCSSTAQVPLENRGPAATENAVYVVVMPDEVSEPRAIVLKKLADGSGEIATCEKRKWLEGSKSGTRSNSELYSKCKSEKVFGSAKDLEAFLDRAIQYAETHPSPGYLDGLIQVGTAFAVVGATPAAIHSYHTWMSRRLNDSLKHYVTTGEDPGRHMSLVVNRLSRFFNDAFIDVRLYHSARVKPVGVRIVKKNLRYRAVGSVVIAGAAAWVAYESVRAVTIDHPNQAMDARGVNVVISTFQDMNEGLDPKPVSFVQFFRGMRALGAEYQNWGKLN